MSGHDIRFAVRALLRRPGFSLVAIATLALGLGATTAIFSVVHAVLVRPLDLPEPSRLVQVTGLNLRTGETRNLSPADFMDFERQNRVLEHLGAHGWLGHVTITGGSEPERVGGVDVTHAFFPALGVTPARGRLFLPEEDVPGGPHVAVISHGYWQRRFGGDPDIVGRTIEVNARPAEIVGVLPARYRHIEPNPDREAEVFRLFQFERANPNRGGHFIRAVGRLNPGVALSEARAQMETLAAGMEQLHPDTNTAKGVRLRPLHDAMVGETRPALLLLLGAVGFVLLVACANLANLLLAGAAARRQELAVRAALGAGRSRLVRQLLTESAVLSVAGGAAGLLIAYWAIRFLTTLSAAGVPRADSAGLDATVFGFAILLALVTGLVFGAVPALQLSRAGVHDGLKAGARGVTGGGVRRHARDLLVAAEVALSVVLLVGAGLLIRSFQELQSVDPGFARSEVLTMAVSLPTAVYEEGEQIPFYRELMDRVRARPGVRVVGATNTLPLSGNYDSRGIQIDDRPVPVTEAPSPQFRSVTPDYFAAMGIPLLRGRTFDDRDVEGAPRVVVVSDSMARRHWPGEDPVGKRLTFNAGIPQDEQQPVGGPGSREIVGVVGDVKHLALEDADEPFFYTPHAQQPSYHTMTLVVRAAADPGSIAPVVRAELAAMDPGVPLYDVRATDTVLVNAVAAPRFRTILLGLFAGLALLLALVGVYGVVSYLVSQRTQEIGVRIALGAGSPRVVGMLVRQGMVPVLAGVATGLIAAFAASRLLAGLLFGVATTDVPTYAVAAVALIAAALVATVVPAARAAGVDPVVALRV